jgi:hypothetical protein
MAWMLTYMGKCNRDDKKAMASACNLFVNQILNEFNAKYGPGWVDNISHPTFIVRDKLVAIDFTVNHDVSIQKELIESMNRSWPYFEQQFNLY